MKYLKLANIPTMSPLQVFLYYFKVNFSSFRNEQSNCRDMFADWWGKGKPCATLRIYIMVFLFPTTVARLCAYI